jgi:hypothetical protein
MSAGAIGSLVSRIMLAPLVLPHDSLSRVFRGAIL